MIVTPLAGRLLVITQNDHAHLAGELLSLWRTDGLPQHPRRRELLFAAREHDNGWREVDSAPLCRPDGRPHDFTTVARELRWEIWRRGTVRYADSEPYAALLIVRHALHLHRAHRDDPAWSDVLTGWRDLAAELEEAAGVERADVDRDYRWIDLTDLLSLAACNRWRRPLARRGFAAELRTPEDGDGLAGNTLVLDPFPLAGATTFEVGCRLIPDRAFSGDADFGSELAAARWRRYAVRLAPAAPRSGEGV